MSLVLGLLLSSCLDENESPKIEITENAKIAKIKNWFEVNESNLRLPKAGANYRTDAQELILPFFKKEPDWDKFHHYNFPDGREVYEINLGNEQGYFLKSMVDSFPDQDVSKIAIQNIMFIKHPTLERYDPLIARYFPDNDLSIRDFESISFNGINEFWSGKVEIFTYDEHHFITFIIKEGVVIGTERYEGISNTSSSLNSRITADCRQIEVTYSIFTPEGNYGGTLTNITQYVSSCSTTAADTYTPSGGTNPNQSSYDYRGNPGGGGGAGGNFGTSYNPPRISVPKPKLISLLTNKCADDIFKNLAKGSKSLTNLNGLGALDISTSILRLFENGAKFDYEIINEDLVGKNAETEIELKTNLITVKLDNNYVQNATSLSIARTIIHETVHAYLLNTIHDRDIRANSSIFPLLQEYHAKYGQKEANNYQHATMSHYLLAMAVSLYNWDRQFGPTQGTLGFDYYYKMAFGGLVDQNNPNNLIQEAKQYIPAGSSWSDINKILSDEAKGTNQAKGKKCK